MRLAGQTNTRDHTEDSESSEVISRPISANSLTCESSSLLREAGNRAPGKPRISSPVSLIKNGVKAPAERLEHPKLQAVDGSGGPLLSRFR